ncbi:MAG: hypothetical protein KBG29_19465 [Pseudomonadales bacterium]|nr:hypothetical protein [Pseudomonadales bacterium]
MSTTPAQWRSRRGAGQLRLRDGALIPGELKRVESRSIVWHAQLIGDITVETKSIASLDSTTAARLQFGDGGHWRIVP